MSIAVELNCCIKESNPTEDSRAWHYVLCKGSLSVLVEFIGWGNWNESQLSYLTPPSWPPCAIPGFIRHT